MTLRRLAPALVSLTLAFALAPVRTLAQPETSTLVGVYQAHGINANGTNYTGYVVIAMHGDSLLAVWRSVQADGTVAPEPDAAGVGIVSGMTFSVAFFGKQGSGLVVYTIQEDGSLVGQWTLAGADGALLPEVLTKVTGHPAPVPVPPPADDETPGTPEPRTVRAPRAA
jgi:hypothetical protein